MDKKYSLTSEHRAQLGAWRDRWIANALSTAPITAIDRDRLRCAIRGLYEAAGLKPPPDHRIVIVPSPIVAAFASGFAAAIWWRRKHPIRAAATDATRAVATAATYAVTRAAAAATYAATVAATDAATRAATYAAVTDAATRAATYATDAATRAATYAATYAAATTYATDATDATDAATYAAATDGIDQKWWTLGHCRPLDIARIAQQIGGDDARFLLMCAQRSWYMRNGGNQWSGWAAYLSFFRHVVKLPLDYSKWAHYEDAAQLGGPRYMHEEFCIISERPEVLTVDEQNRPHSDTGPFCRWRDGTSLYSVHGERRAVRAVW